jgi:hypothetical protein
LFGQSVIGGFSATASDVIELSAKDWPDFASLQPDITQSGNNTLITLDASDTITLTNVVASSLTAAQFKLV